MGRVVLRLRRSEIPKKRKNIATLAGMCVLLAGCADPGSSADDQVQVSSTTTKPASPKESAENKAPARIQPAGVLAGKKLPLEDYMVQHVDRMAVQEAKTKVTEQCMAKLAVKWSAPPMGSDPPRSSNSMNMARRYGAMDLGIAEKYGYRVPTDDEPAEDDLGEEELLALRGINSDGTKVDASGRQINGRQIPEGGCAGEADRKIGVLNEQTAVELAGNSFVASLKDPRVVKATENWSSCMSAKGFDAQDPLGIITTFRTGGNEISDAEKDTAVADVNCKKDTGLATTWFDVETELQSDLIAKNRPSLDGALGEIKRTISRAAS